MAGRAKAFKAVLAVVLVLAAALVFSLVGPPGLLQKSDKPEFCVKCHVMEYEYEAWMHAGAHRREMCVDCHLPNENRTVHYVWKAIDGLKDVAVFYSGRVPEQIELTGHGKEVLRQNCVRCHETVLSLTDTERKCWGCHRRVSHRLAGEVASI